MKKTILLSLMALSTSAYSAEADNFTARTLEMKDVSAEVNAFATNYLKKAVTDLNTGNSECDEDALYKELRKYFANHMKGELIKDILYKNKVEIYSLPIQKSVYSSWKASDGFILGREKAAKSPLALSPLIKIGDQVVGVDKLEHMFGMGFSYFGKHYNKGKSIDKILKYGIALEKTILGGNILATGVFSYGDLAANFNGMRFWNHVLQKNDDILGAHENRGPFVRCEQNKWSIVETNSIDLRNYLDASTDESINCSKFAASKAVDKFKNEVKKRGYVSTEGAAACPVEPEILKQMREKYKPSGIEHWIINNEGIGQVSYFNEF